ncbi:MAG: RNA 3'-terminal phosphate cyclase [Candidatus Bathyarchaeia archaeon]
MIEVAGDTLEGGGQIVRTSVALAALASVDVRITKIRDKRPNPGLQPQHVTAVKALAKMSNAQTEGLTQGSRELVFRPRGRTGGNFRFDVGTAGSIPLILQALMPSLAFAPDLVELELIGGTDVKWSPSIDYVRLAILPTLQLMGYQANLLVNRRGHYPRGGGRVIFKIVPPKMLHAIQITKRDQQKSIEGVSHCVKLPSHVAQRQAEAARKRLLKDDYEVKVAIETHSPDQDQNASPGSGITLVTRFMNGSVLGADSVGERGKPAEKVGEDCAGKLLEELKSNGSFDRHLGDILIPFMAVAEGRSEISVSQMTTHTLTNIHVAEQILNVKFQTTGVVGEFGTIVVEGIGLKT